MGKQARNYTQQTIKKLFALSASQCSFPHCGKKIVNQSNAKDSNICHIQGANPNGERYNPNMTDKERANYDNLILLCQQHHDQTDDVSYYTVEVLLDMKKSHENKIQNLLSPSIKKLGDIETLKQFIYFMKEENIPLLNLEYMVKSLPSSINNNFLFFSSFFENFIKDNRDCYPFNDNQLNTIFNNFIDKYMTLINKIMDNSINGAFQYNNFVPLDRSSEMQMNKQYLSYENISNLNQEIELLKYDFVSAYIDFINFLRECYSEVNLR